jgi:hypothetical protein
MSSSAYVVASLLSSYTRLMAATAHDELSFILRLTVSRPVCLGIKHPSGAYDQIFIIVWQLPVCWFGAPSLTRGRICRLQLLLDLASTVIFGSESRRTLGHILLSQIQDFPFRRLLRLAGSRWRYSTPPPHRFAHDGDWLSTASHRVWPNTKHHFQHLLYCCIRIYCCGSQLSQGV